MIVELKHNKKDYKVDLSAPLDISLPLTTEKDNAKAWYVEPMKIEPVVMGDWIGDVNQGGSVNFKNVFFNPHGHGTHTECVGHISKESYSINRTLTKFFFMSRLVSVEPVSKGENRVITSGQIPEMGEGEEALIIRTLPNDSGKLTRQYSNTNPPYLSLDAIQKIRASGVKHLLIDLPSVDPEKDDGALLAHREFWNYPVAPDLEATITEMIYVPKEVSDGIYLLNIQMASFENDAAPSKPVLYSLS